MDSRHAQKIVIAVIVLLLLALAFFFFFLRKTPSTPVNNPPGNPFGTSTGNTVFPGNGSTNGSNGGATGSTTVTLSPAEAEAVSACSSSISVERSDCIKQAAVQSKDPTLCAAIPGTFGQIDCKTSVTQAPQKPVDVFSKTIASYTFPFGSNPTSTVPNLTSQLTDLLGDVSNKVQDAMNNPDPRFTAQGFMDRLRASPVTLFNFSDYQIKPGSVVTANGFGFALTGNDVHIGGVVISNIPSSDGMAMTLTVPSNTPEGTYEAWVTNSSGSSKKPNQPIQVIITNNPAPRPIITGISPAVPTLSDTVTLSGANLNGAIGLFTSFGVLKKFSSAPASITFNMADFDIIDKIKDLPNLKGQKVSVSVIVATPQGYNKDMFTFGVQF